MRFAIQQNADVGLLTRSVRSTREAITQAGEALVVQTTYVSDGPVVGRLDHVSADHIDWSID